MKAMIKVVELSTDNRVSKKITFFGIPIYYRLEIKITKNEKHESNNEIQNG